MLQQQFQSMASKIVAKCDSALDTFSSSRQRIEAIKDMTTELRTLKEAYSVVVDGAEFIPSLPQS